MNLLATGSHQFFSQCIPIGSGGSASNASFCLSPGDRCGTPPNLIWVAEPESADRLTNEHGVKR